jgi:bla regulator protein blaR1
MRSRNRSLMASFLLAILIAPGWGSLQAQRERLGVEAASSRPEFDVASIKPNRSVSPARAGFRPNAFEAVNATARQLITLAYGSDPQNVVDEVIGGPAWLDSERFDVSARGATADGVANMAQGRAMLQSLLEDRFNIRVHRERQERPVYKLVIAPGDRPASGLKRAPLDCGTRADTRPAGTPGLAYCGIDRAPGRSTGRSMPMRLLADTLSSRVGRKIIDETGLPGEWDWDLEWSPAPSEPVTPGDITAAPAPADGPSIFAAVQEQLGLRLESGRALLDVLIIDVVERPSPN